MEVKPDVEVASISLFSSAGIGDLGIEYGCNIPVVLSAELLHKRVKLIRKNYKHRKVMKCDISKRTSSIKRNALKILGKKRPLLMTLSPPCQGMSTNGAGKIAAEVKKGKRPKHDKRNKLLIPGLNLINSLQPEYFLIENVPNMKNTIIRWRKKPKKLIEMIQYKIKTNYEIHSFVIDFADYGVPQHRKRLITIGKRTEQKITSFTLHENPPEWFDSGSLTEHIALVSSIGNLTESIPGDPLRQCPQMSDKHKFWASIIPKNSGETAYNNHCIEPNCNYKGEVGAVTCSKCSSPLPRPSKIGKDGKLRLITGFNTSYRRMLPDKPANTVTMNSGVLSSDVKIHYEEDRVLNLKEIMVLTSLCNIENPISNIFTKYPWHGKYDFSSVMKPSDYLLQKNIIRQSLGESIPPLAMQRMVKSLLEW